MYKSEVAALFPCHPRTLRTWVMKRNAKLAEEKKPIIEYGDTKGILPALTVKRILVELLHSEA